MSKMNLKNKHFYGILLVYSILFTIVSFYSSNVASIIYDQPFHVGRIVGLAKSIQNLDLLPNLNPLFVGGSGYAVPMFYGNWMLYLPAVVYLITGVATFAFGFFVFQSTLATVWSSYFTLEKITGNRVRACLGSISISCSVTYFGFGMTAVVPLIPLLLYAIYKVIFEEKYNPVLLAVIISLLIQTHVISTIVLAISSFVLICLNFVRLNKQKILSFVQSVCIAFALVAGYLLQYFEQFTSQTFFVSWKLRDFPFPSESLMSPGELTQMISQYFWPSIYIYIFISLIIFRRLQSFSKQLIFTTILMFAFSTRLIPWELLRESFLSVFQYTERLTYLLPIFVIFSLSLSAPKVIVSIVTCLQILVYLVTQPFHFTPNSIPYSERGFQDSTNYILAVTNRDAHSAFTDPFSGEYTYDTSGDEYFTIDINHENVRNGTLQKFDYDENKLSISNVQQDYNRLEFDINLLNQSNSQQIVLPRVWYKGYVAEYSQGAKGSQPKLDYGTKSKDEIKADSESGKSKEDKKVLHDGRAVIYINKSGHVKIEYRKTLIQWIGYIIEFISFVIVFIYGLVKLNSRKNKTKK